MITSFILPPYLAFATPFSNVPMGIEIPEALEQQKMNVRVLDDKTLAASFDETHLEVPVIALVKRIYL